MKNDFMKRVYDSPQYLPFDFTQDLITISQQFNYLLVVSRGYALVTNKQTIYQLDVAPARYETALLAKHQLIILKWQHSEMNTEESLEKFKQLLLQAMLRWIERYTSMLSDHFSARVSENRTLNNHNSIKIMMGETLAELAYVAELIKNPRLFLIASESIKNMAIKLHKVSGGRAFLQSNIVEMLCIFEVIRKIYF